MDLFEKIYTKSGYPDLDKHDKKVPKFSYYDMLDLGESCYNQNKRQTPWTIYRIISRIIVYPFVIAIIVLSSIIWIIKSIIDYSVYGSELVILRKGTEKNAIKYLVEKLKEKL